MKKAALFLAIGTGLLTVSASASAQTPDVDCKNAENQVEMNYCAEQELDDADQLLNDVWRKTKATAARIDKDAAQSGEPKGNEAALLKAQRAWIDYRDNTCEAESYPYRSGTIYSQIKFSCLSRVTGVRTQDLKQMYTDFEE